MEGYETEVGLRGEGVKMGVAKIGGVKMGEGFIFFQAHTLTLYKKYCT
jgi:hypothetical protein